jgi:hypothetical protein
MILRAATMDSIFLGASKTGQRLARIENYRAGTRNGIDVFSRRRGGGGQQLAAT